LLPERILLPEIVTFWHGPLDRLRQTCLRSQIAAGHKVTVYSFDPVAGLPDGVGNAEAEAILPHSFSERLRPPQRSKIVVKFTHHFPRQRRDIRHRQSEKLKTFPTDLAASENLPLYHFRPTRRTLRTEHVVTWQRANIAGPTRQA